MSQEAIRSFIEWLKPIAHNDTEAVESVDTISTQGRQCQLVRKIKYNPYRALWATVILSGLCTDYDNSCKNIDIDVEYLNSDLFIQNLEDIGCKIPANELRRGILA